MKDALLGIVFLLTVIIFAVFGLPWLMLGMEQIFEYIFVPYWSWVLGG